MLKRNGRGGSVQSSRATIVIGTQKDLAAKDFGFVDKAIQAMKLPGQWSRFAGYLLLAVSFLVIPGCSGGKVEIKDVSDVGGVVESPRSFHVIVISGLKSDPTKEQIEGTAFRGSGNSGMFQLAGDLEAKGFECSFFNWNGTDAGDGSSKEAPGAMRIAESMVAIAVKKPETEFLLVGHSWGAHAIMDVASLLRENEAIKIMKAFVIDPSSTMRGKRAETMPAVIPEMDNYYTNNSFCWGAWKDEPRINNISLADPENGFVVDGHPNYGSTFDWNAHTAAEWDQKIHADICSKIEAIVKNAK